MLSTAKTKVFLFGCLIASAHCNSTIDVSAQRGALQFRFSDAGCGVSYTGMPQKSALDITCPASLRGKTATFHLSAPLTTPRALILADEHFREAGYQLGQFVVVTYVDGERTIQCDPLKATGSVIYSSIPRPGMMGRLAGRFSEDAELANCQSDNLADAGPPLRLSGTFDVAAPE